MDFYDDPDSHWLSTDPLIFIVRYIHCYLPFSLKISQSVWEEGFILEVFRLWYPTCVQQVISSEILQQI